MSGPGLCAGCRHSQEIPSPKGTTYLLCRLGLTDATFRKYPTLPVLQCRGYAPAEN
jgi:hypothetical protein